MKLFFIALLLSSLNLLDVQSKLEDQPISTKKLQDDGEKTSNVPEETTADSAQTATFAENRKLSKNSHANVAGANHESAQNQGSSPNSSSSRKALGQSFSQGHF